MGGGEEPTVFFEHESVGPFPFLGGQNVSPVLLVAHFAGGIGMEQPHVGFPFEEAGGVFGRNIPLGKNIHPSSINDGRRCLEVNVFDDVAPIWWKMCIKLRLCLPLVVGSL